MKPERKEKASIVYEEQETETQVKQTQDTNVNKRFTYFLNLLAC